VGRMGLNGLLNVNKPAGCSSFSIVAGLRRLSGERRVGHAGTLDPAASGVLPVCLGQATRLAEYMLDYPKQYLACIELGASTDTYDSEGHIIAHGSMQGISRKSVEEALLSFLGRIEQVPPAFSAVKIRGRKSYALARAGQQVALKPRNVHIYQIEITAFDLPYLTLNVSCSKGTYMRSLANDLGIKLGCYGYLKNLERTAYGPFNIEAAFTPQQLDEAAAEGRLEQLLLPMDFALTMGNRIYLDDQQAASVLKGLDIAIDVHDPYSTDYCSAYTQDGRLLAVMKFAAANGLWHPHKVFNL